MILQHTRKDVVRKNHIFFLTSKAIAFEVIFLQRTIMHSLRSHTCALRSVFRHAHVVSENEFDFISPRCGETL